MVRRVFNFLTVLSLLSFIVVVTLWVQGMLGWQRNLMRGSVAGGMGLGHDDELMIFWAGDLTGVRNGPSLHDYQIPGAMFRRVAGPKWSYTLFIAHWFAAATAAALPTGWLVSRWAARRARHRRGFAVDPAAVVLPTKKTGPTGGPGLIRVLE